MHEHDLTCINIQCTLYMYIHLDAKMKYLSILNLSFQLAYWIYINSMSCLNHKKERLFLMTFFFEVVWYKTRICDFEGVWFHCDTSNLPIEVYLPVKIIGIETCRNDLLHACIIPWSTSHPLPQTPPPFWLQHVIGSTTCNCTSLLIQPWPEIHFVELNFDHWKFLWSI